MNNLVAYDADSDEDSPRRRSTSDASKNEKEQRKRGNVRKSDEYGESNDDSSPETNFVEPPPPKRVSEHSPSPAAFRTPQLGLPNVSSTASLVSYSGEGDEDEDVEMSEKDKMSGESSAPSTVLHEPAPPARESMDAESDEEQKLIDLAIQEGNEAMSKMGGAYSPAGSESTQDQFQSDSPLQNPPNPQEMEEKEVKILQILEIPGEPEGIEVDPQLAAKFERAFQQKAHGIDLNQQIQGNSQFNNPMSYESFIEKFDIDEKGTNFGRNIFNPHVFPDNCYYDAISEEQRKASVAVAKKPTK